MIETYPLLAGGTPFPTLWWLTCRALASAISALESQGWTATVNRRLQEDVEFRRRLEESTRRYIEARDRLAPLSQSHHPGGGPERVKCLHAHTAHHLVSGDNPVGAAVLERLGWVDPGEPCI